MSNEKSTIVKITKKSRTGKYNLPVRVKMKAKFQKQYVV